MLSRLGVNSVITRYTKDIKNILLGQTAKTTNTTYGLNHINISNDNKYHALCIYGSFNSKLGIWVSSNYGLSFTNT